MPPQIFDEDASDMSGNEYEALAPAPASPPPAAKLKQEKKEKAKEAVKEEETLMVEGDENEEEDDDEVAEDEYIVEAITNHLVDEDTGELRFEVKWEGYEKKSDRTWEPEENLETASKILNEYLASVGGKELILSAWEEKKAEAGLGKKGKKRGRANTGTTQEANGTKRGRKNKDHPASATPPSSASHAEFKPPTGSWEDAVVAIDACEGNDNNVVVYLTWKGGYKTQHPLAQVYKRCPQKMLHFYESHLVFKKNEDMS